MTIPRPYSMISAKKFVIFYYGFASGIYFFHFSITNFGISSIVGNILFQIQLYVLMILLLFVSSQLIVVFSPLKLKLYFAFRFNVLSWSLTYSYCSLVWNVTKAFIMFTFLFFHNHHISNIHLRHYLDIF